MPPLEPLALHHSWPLAEAAERFDLGRLFDAAITSPDIAPMPGGWSCNLADEALTWSPEVHALFGVPTSAPIRRAEAIRLYREHSRAATERLRAYALRHRRGFTLDVEIDAMDGRHRWMRIAAAPVIDNDAVVRLHGIKRDVSHLYSR